MLNRKLLKELQVYIKNNLIEEKYALYEQATYSLSYKATEIELKDYINVHRKDSFAERLFSFIDKKGLDDVEVYKKAGIDRRHFSKIRSNPDYQISKQTGIALAFALELSLTETEELLQAAGFSLSEYDTYDLIVQFFLEKEIYDTDELNQALVYYGLKPL